MKKILKNDKKITSRNYYMVLIVSIIVIVLTLYVRSFIINYQNNVNNTSIFKKNNIKSITINDLDYIIPETDEAIIYVRYTGDRKVTAMESKLYKEIKKKKLEEKIIYLNITDNLEGNEYTVLLKEKLKDVKEKINTPPMLIYIKDGKCIDAMSSELKQIDYKVFDKLVEEYNITD